METKKTTAKDESLGLTNANQNDNLVSGETETLESTKKPARLEPITDTPFTLLSDEDTKTHCVLFGLFKITEDRKTAQEAIDDLSKTTWNTFINIMDAMIQMDKENSLRTQNTK